MKINPSPKRSGFTLVELLLVIAIIAILSSLALGVMASAQNDARRSATISRISQLKAIFALELDGYTSRRLPVDRSALTGNRSNRLRLRRTIIEDIIRVEMPTPQKAMPLQLDDNDQPVYVAESSTNPSETIMQTIGVFPFDTSITALTPPPTPTGGIAFWQSLAPLYPLGPGAELDNPGEYLYLILSRIDVDGLSGLDALGGSAVGDSDNDGILEIVDSWGDFLTYNIVAVPDSSEFEFIVTSKNLD